NAGDTYLFGAAGTTELAFGSLLSGTVATKFGVAIKNTTGNTLKSFTVSYTGEQWRRGNTGTGADRLAFSYWLPVTGDASPGEMSAANGNYVNDTTLDFSSPVTAPSSGNGSLNGNDPANQKLLTDTINNITWAPGVTLVLVWTDIDI